MNSNRDTLILGGGLAGLGAAYHSGAPVYECRDRVGGSADSYVKDGFVFDIGIHVLQSRIEYFHDLMTTIGVDFVDCKRNAWIYSFGRYAAYPFQVNTSHLAPCPSPLAPQAAGTPTQSNTDLFAPPSPSPSRSPAPLGAAGAPGSGGNSGPNAGLLAAAVVGSVLAAG